MSRFYFPDMFFNIRDSGSLLAFFTFVDNDTGLEYSNWRLVQGQNGPFVSSPFQSPEPKPGQEQKYYNFVRPAYDSSVESKRNAKGVEFFQALQEAAYAYYEKKKTGGSAPAKGSSSGRGPVADADDDLPF